MEKIAWILLQKLFFPKRTALLTRYGTGPKNQIKKPFCFLRNPQHRRGGDQCRIPLSSSLPSESDSRFKARSPTYATVQHGFRSTFQRPCTLQPGSERSRHTRLFPNYFSRLEWIGENGDGEILFIFPWEKQGRGRYGRKEEGRVVPGVSECFNFRPECVQWDGFFDSLIMVQSSTHNCHMLYIQF